MRAGQHSCSRLILVGLCTSGQADAAACAQAQDVCRCCARRPGSAGLAAVDLRAKWPDQGERASWQSEQPCCAWAALNPAGNSARATTGEHAVRSMAPLPGLAPGLRDRGPCSCLRGDRQRLPAAFSLLVRFSRALALRAARRGSRARAARRLGPGHAVAGGGMRCSAHQGPPSRLHRRTEAPDNCRRPEPQVPPRLCLALRACSSCEGFSPAAGWCGRTAIPACGAAQPRS